MGCLWVRVGVRVGCLWVRSEGGMPVGESGGGIPVGER